MISGQPVLTSGQALMTSGQRFWTCIQDPSIWQTLLPLLATAVSQTRVISEQSAQRLGF